MVVEVGDHPVRGFGSRPLAVGDVVESLCGPVQFVGQMRYGPSGIAGQFGRGSARNRIEDAALLQLACDGSESVADRGRPIARRRILFGGRAVFGGAELMSRRTARSRRRGWCAWCAGQSGPPPRTAIASRISRTLSVNQPPGTDAPSADQLVQQFVDPVLRRSVSDAFG